jgi:sulfur-oxidizing protein SoxY
MIGQTEQLPMTRRQMMGGLTAGALLLGVGLTPFRTSLAAETPADQKIGELAGNREIKEGRIFLDVPEIAENGNTVPVAFEVESPMSDEDYVKSVHILADGNPAPDVATFDFTPMSGIAAASTRIRLAKTQNIVVLAEMSDGSVYMAKSEVKVTIGGCGG